jgi:hypothetical protein
MVDIKTNLLKNRRTLSEKEYQKEQNYLRFSIVSLVVVVVVIVAVSIWNFVLTSKLSSIENSITSTNKQMQGLSQASAQQIYLKSRLNLLTGFLSDRSVARESLQKILSTDIAGTHLSNLGFVDDATLGVSYVASNSANLSDLVKYYESDTGYYPQVVSTGVSRADDSSYQLSLLLTLPKASK